MYLSVVVPVYDEEANIESLLTQLKPVLDSLNKPYEVVMVDDGSRDQTSAILDRLKPTMSQLIVVRLRRNYGQTLAMMAGFAQAKGKIIITMDGDLQNDPADIPALLQKLESGFDVVSGWRHQRKDSFSKKFFSKISNAFARRMTGVEIHDFGCTLKAYRREALEGLKLYGEMHRYIPAFVKWNGFVVGELPVQHHPRQRGTTKYGFSRLLRGFLDLLYIRYLIKYASKPMYFFGLLGVGSMAIGGLTGLGLVAQKLLYNTAIGDRPLLLLAVLLFFIGIQFITLGFLSGMMLKQQAEAGAPLYTVVRRKV